MDASKTPNSGAFHHSLFFQIYLYFTIILSVFAVLIGLIFMELNEKNMVKNYEKQLLNQAKTLSTSVSTYMINKDTTHYNSYIVPWQEMLTVESTDIWILSNPDAEVPMSSDFTTINVENMELSKDMEKTMLGYEGKTIIVVTHKLKTEDYGKYDKVIVI